SASRRRFLVFRIINGTFSSFSVSWYHHCGVDSLLLLGIVSSRFYLVFSSYAVWCCHCIGGFCTVSSLLL
ncbi:5199_t:CDS:2, partial [Gigaspora rosea]